MGGGDGQRQVAHQIVGSAIGGGGGGDRTVHQVLVHQLVLSRCSGGDLRLDGVDVVGIRLLSGLGTALLVAHHTVDLGLGVGGGLWCRDGTGLGSRADGVEVYDGGLLAGKEVGQFSVRRQGGEFGHEARGDARIQGIPLGRREAGVVEGILEGPHHTVELVPLDAGNLRRRGVGGRNLHEGIVVVVGSGDGSGEGGRYLLAGGGGGERQVANEVVGSLEGGGVRGHG